MIWTKFWFRWLLNKAAKECVTCACHELVCQFKFVWIPWFISCRKLRWIFQAFRSNYAYFECVLPIRWNCSFRLSVMSNGSIFFFVYCVFRFLLSNIEENVFDFSSKINVDIRKLCLHTKLKEIHAHKSRCWLLISWFGYVRCSEFLYWRMLCVYVIVLFFCFFHRSSLLSWIFNVVPLPLVHLIRFI